MREAAARYWLRVQVGQRQLGEVSLGRTHLSVGRSPRAQLAIDDPFASRLHAELWSDGEACWLSDLGSSNGTYLNGSRVSGTTQIFTGDRVRIGETLLTVESVTEEQAAGKVTTLDPAESRPGVVLTALLASAQQAGRQATGPQPLQGQGPAPRDLFAVISKVGVALLSQSGLDEVLPAILELVFDGIPAERAFLLLLDEGVEEPRLAASSYRAGTPKPREGEVKISREVQRQVLTERVAVLSTDAQLDQRFKNRESVILSGVRSIMAVPLQVGEQVLGMVYVDSRLEVRPFSGEDLQVLTTIAGVAAIKVENAVLLEQRIENERLHEELNKAREIQVRLLPSRPPQPPGYELSGVSFPSQAVGGDYFDFVPLDSGGTLLAVGDVSGKGLDAALSMSSLHACVRSQARAGLPLPELMRQVNRYLCESLPYNKFATLFCAVLDHAGHTLTFVNAGHNPPLLVRADGSTVELPATGMPTGLDQRADYEMRSEPFGVGDVLLAFSDGVTDASPEGLGGDPLGSERLAEWLGECRQMPARSIVDRLDERLIELLAGRDADDDMTLLVVRRTPA